MSSNVLAGPVATANDHPEGEFHYGDDESDHELDVLFEMFKEKIPEVFPTSMAESEEQNKRFSGASFRYVTIHFGPWEKEDVVGMVYFINLQLLNPRKLPPLPLVFEKNTVNGRSLEEFVIKIYTDRESKF